MREKGALAHMRNNGVKYVYFGPVDNVLIKLGDPMCVGYLVQNGCEIGSTYVKKTCPAEPMGVHVLKNGKVTVCEYNEIPKALSEARDEKGELVYCHGNRATMLMSVDFIDKITSPEMIARINKKYHLAEKKIKCWDPIVKKSSKP
jgi:UDP-N-acetylglucosamine pyrophosphorylase